MSDEEEYLKEEENDRRRLAQRRLPFEQFRERQRVLRQWIAFDEIADWCAHSVTGASAAAEEHARTLAYHRLDHSVRTGRFDGLCQGQTQSKILYFDPRHGEGRLLREQLQLYAGQSIRDIAAYCWLPRGLARQWLVDHCYSWSANFDPAPATTAAKAVESEGVSSFVVADTNDQALPALPKLSVAVGIRTNKAEAAEEECRQWIGRLRKRPPSKDEAFDKAKAAVEQTGQLSRKAFERAWASAAPSEWKKGGRRKKIR